MEFSGRIFNENICVNKATIQQCKQSHDIAASLLLGELLRTFFQWEFIEFQRQVKNHKFCLCYMKGKTINKLSVLSRLVFTTSPHVYFWIFSTRHVCMSSGRDSIIFKQVKNARALYSNSLKRLFICCLQLSAVPSDVCIEDRFHRHLVQFDLMFCC